jgi:hypothetical protein
MTRGTGVAPVPLFLCQRAVMLRIPLVVGLTLFLGGAACSDSASASERAACAAAQRLLAAEDRPQLREHVKTMVARSEGNEALHDAAADYEAALDDREEGAAAAAIGRFYDECDRLGLQTP